MRCFATKAWPEVLLQVFSRTGLEPMKSTAFDFFMPRTLLICALAAGAVAPPLLQAQQVYRIVGPDGRVTFSDRPPSADSANSTKVGEASAGGVPRSRAAPAGLPFELRQTALKYPVVLYTADNCAPCAAGRVLLTSRGVPFIEKTVATAADTDALQRLSGGSSLPLLTIGSQRFSGFSDLEWTEFLTAAGYPKSSVLLPSYRPPAPAPLVAVAAAPAGETKPVEPAGTAPAARSVPPPVNSAAPSSIRF